MHGPAVKELFNVLTPRDAFARLEPQLRGPRATERILTASALGRVLAEDLRSPGATGRSTSIVSPSTSWVFSTITTASAPSGTIPPVAMRTVSPRRGPRSAGWPISTSPTTLR